MKNKTAIMFVAIIATLAMCIILSLMKEDTAFTFHQRSVHQAARELERAKEYPGRDSKLYRLWDAKYNELMKHNMEKK